MDTKKPFTRVSRVQKRNFDIPDRIQNNTLAASKKSKKVAFFSKTKLVLFIDFECSKYFNLIGLF